MSNHVIQSFTTSLPPRVMRLLLLALALLVTGTTIGAFSHGASATRARARHTVSVPVTAAQPIITSAPTLLPAVVVRPDRGMTVLATITVRPERALRASANRDETSDFAFNLNDSASVPPVAHSTSSGSGFAMPYYSFSSSARHSNKE